MPLSKLTTGRGATLATVFGSARFLPAQAITTGQTKTVDVDVSDYDLVTILVSMSAAAGTDLTLTVVAIEQDGVTPFPVALPTTGAAATFVSPNAVQAVQVNCTGLKGIEIQVKNNNAGSQTINFVDVFAGVTGTDF